MKLKAKILTLVLALAMLFSIIAVLTIPAGAAGESEGTIIYFTPNSDWKKDGARFAAYYWEGEDPSKIEGWSDVVDFNGDGVYQFTLPAEFSNFKFVRMNSSTTENDWINKWNEDSNLTVQADGKNYYTLNDGWDNVGGTWHTFSETYTAAGKEALFGSDWSATDTNNDLVLHDDGTYKKTYYGVAVGSYEMKVTYSHSWAISYGNNNGGNISIDVTNNNSTVTVCFVPSTKEVVVTVCGHTDENKLTTDTDPASCTEDGLKTVTCECGATVSTEVLTATGHSFNGGATCANCREPNPNYVAPKPKTETITITRDNFTGSAYAWNQWTVGEISGYGYTYGKATTIQVNGDKTGDYIYNTTALPGKIVSITLTKASGNDRNFDILTSDTPFNHNTTASLKSQATDAKKLVTTDGVTWTFETNHKYFAIVIVDKSAAYLSSIEIVYEENNCEHTYNKGETTAPTCTEDGYTEYTCSKCGHTKTDDLVPATGHSYTEEITTPATCTTNGTKTFTCSCGDTYTEIIEATGHNVVNGECSVCHEKTEIATLVTDASTLKAGDKIIIVAAGSDFALSTTQNTNNRGQIAITKNGYSITIIDGIQILTLEAGTETGTFAFNTGSGYLYAASTSANHLKTETTISDDGSWLITIANGIATIKAQGIVGRNWLRYNSSSKIFSCYSSGQSDVSIYVIPAVECAHTNKISVPAKDATCGADGYTAHEVCNDCGSAIGKEPVPATGEHNFANAVCSVCNAINYGTLDNPVSVSDALNATKDFASGEASTECFYVQGVVTKFNTANDNGVYYNIYIGDGTNEILIYSISAADGVAAFDKGDTIIAYGYIKNYTTDSGDVIQMTSVSGVYVKAVSVVDGCANGHTNALAVRENESSNKVGCVITTTFDSVVYCSVCDAEVSRSDGEDTAYAHNFEGAVVVPVKDVTCTENGVKEAYKQCAQCDYYFKADADTTAPGSKTNPWIISATGNHTGVEIPAVAATCTTAGSTAGIKCSVCDEVLTAPETVDALGHTEEEISAVAATCTTAGSTAGVKCSVCGEVLTAPEPVDALGHTEEVVPGKAATCTEAGLTDGKKCSVCDEVLVEQQTVNKNGHTFDIYIEYKAATCTEKGNEAYQQCSVCKIYTKEGVDKFTEGGVTYTAAFDIAAKGHTEEVVPGKAATCTEAGLTDGKKCSVCDKVLVEQQKIEATGDHSYADGKCTVCSEPDPNFIAGELNAVYTSNENGVVTIWGELKANPKTSLHIEILDSDGNVMGSVKLNNIGGIIDGSAKYLSWHMIVLGEDEDEYWTTTWNEGYPSASVQPATARLVVDGKTVDENVKVQMTNADNLNPVEWNKLFVAEVNGNIYGSLQAAINAAGKGDTITLLCDTSEKGTEVEGGSGEFFIQIIDKEVVIDLGGYKLNGSLYLNSGATLTIDNGAIETLAGNASSCIESVGGSIVLGEKLSIHSSARHAIRVKGGNAVINGGTYKADGNGTYHVVNISHASTVTINGGTFTSNKGNSAAGGNAVMIQDSASTVTINDGTFQNASGVEGCISAAAGLTICGGKFDTWTYDDYLVSDKCAELIEGYYRIVDPVATVGDKNYGLLQSAINAAGGEKITLLVDVNEIITTDKAFDLDLNGKTVYGYFFLTGEATIANGGIDSTSTSKAGIEVSKNSVLTLTDVTIVSKRHAIRVDGGELTVNSGTYTTIGNAGAADTCHAINAGGGDFSYAKVTIHDGTFNGLGATDAYESQDSGAAITAQTGATFTVYGGTFNGKYAETIADNYGGSYILHGGKYDQSPIVAGVSLADGKCVHSADGYYEVKDHTPEPDKAVDPTCTETGLTEGSHCSNCNKVLVAQEPVDALGHKYENGVCQNEGCGDKKYIEIGGAIVNYDGDVTALLEALKSNGALAGNFEITLPEGVELVVKLTKVDGLTSIVFDVAPMKGDVQETLENKITFRLPVPAAVNKTHAHVKHGGEWIGTYKIQGDGDSKYVEISAKDFSEYSLEFVNAVAMVGEFGYASLDEALAAVAENGTVKLVADIALDSTITLDKFITLDGNEHTITSTADVAIAVTAENITINNLTVNVAASKFAISIYRSAYINADFNLADGADIISGEISDKAGVKVYFKIDYKELLATRGFLTSDAENSMILLGSRLSYYIGKNGNWYFNGEDTGHSATGADGKTPEIGENGNWWIDETDTGVPATGTTPHIDEATGNWFIGTKDTGVPAKGQNGETPEFKIENGNLYARFPSDPADKWTDLGPVVGSDGADGKTPEFKIENDHLWVSYDDGASWSDLGNVTGADGSDGTSGADGKTPEFKIEDNKLLVSYDGGGTWTSLGIVVGANGSDGANGSNGADGKTPEFKIEENQLWVSYDDGASWTAIGIVVGSNGSDGSNGADGKTPEFKIENDHLWISYDDGASWSDLGNVTGADGSDGTNGADGKTPEFKIENGELKVSYDDGVTWASLGVVAGSNGSDGADGKTPEISDDGYWVIGGVKTDVPVRGADGKTPSFRIENGNLQVSFDELTWTDLGKVVGKDGLTPHIGENGNWWIGETDTGVPATGATPHIGENGNWWIGNTDTGVKALGKDGNDNNKIVVISIAIAGLCLITTIIAVATTRRRRPWWILT